MTLNQVSKSVMVLMAVAAFIHLAGCKAKKAILFPASGETPGWQKTADTRTFAARDLWQYIDGDAEHYIQAGVISTSTSDYKYRSHLEAVVDVHTMANAEGPRRLLESEKAAGARPVAIGDGGIAFSQSITFRKGVYLVRIVAYQSDPEGEQALMALAHGVEAKL